jgi:hypothetical protein
MQHDINEGNVTWIVKKLNDAMGNGAFTTAEVIVGIAEFAGRIIPTIAETPVQGIQCVNLMGNHILNTAKAGYIAKGYNMNRDAS